MSMQKTFRKTVALTDAQISRLRQLSELDGKDPLIHVRAAIDQYLKEQNFDLALPNEEMIAANFTGRVEDENIARAIWASGVVDRYEFSALVLHEPTKLGIDRGRISKLSVWDPIIKENSKNFIDACIVNYDRGWDIRPSKIAQPYYNAVKALLDSSFSL